MFQPDVAALQPWTVAALFRDRLHHPVITQAERSVVRSDPGEPRHVRSLTLATGLAILFFVLALAFLRTSSPGSAYAVMAVLPPLRQRAKSRQVITADTHGFAMNESARALTQAQLWMQLKRSTPIFVGVLFVMSQLLVANAAVAPVTEEIIDTHELAGFPNPLRAMKSRVSFASASSWRTDPDDELLTLEVTRGVLEVRLEAGSARIDRHASWQAGTARGPLVPGLPATLATGDRLVVMDGYLLSITNRNDVPASVEIHRVRRE
jgi:hypothetical protein